MAPVDEFFQARSYEAVQLTLCLLQDAKLIPIEPTPAIIRFAGELRVALMQILIGKTCDQALEELGKTAALEARAEPPKVVGELPGRIDPAILEARLRDSHATIDELLRELCLDHRGDRHEFTSGPLYDRGIEALAQNTMILGSTTNTAAFSRDIDRKMGELRTAPTPDAHGLDKPPTFLEGWYDCWRCRRWVHESKEAEHLATHHPGV